MRHRLGSILWDFYSYIYDFITTASLKKARREYIKDLCQLKEAEEEIQSLLIIGVGTGHDLSFLPVEIPVTAIDYSQMMLEQTKKWIQQGQGVNIKQMDAHYLDFPDNHFQRVLLPLIIAVTNKPHQVLKEAERVLKPGGRMVVFDKFMDRGQKASFFRKTLNFFSNLFATNINIDFHDVQSQTNLKLIEEKPSIFFGFFKIFILEKE